MSVVRNLAASREGGILVGLCAATECLYEDYAATVLCDLVEAYRPATSADRMPSELQWKALIGHCAGLLAKSRFPRLAEHLMRLRPHNRLAVGFTIMSAEYMAGYGPRRTVPSSDTTARALLAIGDLSTGKLVSFRIQGGPIGGWLAAVGEFLFDLKLAISDSQGVLLYTNCDITDRVQLEVIYDVSLGGEGKLQVSKETVHLRDATEFLRRKTGLSGSALICGRVTWDQALSLTFGSAFVQLMNVRTIFGSALGYAARLFQGLARAEPGLLPSSLENYTAYSHSGYGQGYISFAIKQFAELAPLEPHIQKAAENSLSDVMRMYEANLTMLRGACQCSICELRSDHDRTLNKFCLAILSEAIINLIHCLSLVDVDRELSPVRAGVEIFYHRQRKMRENKQGSRTEKAFKEYGEIAFLVGTDSAFYDMSFSRKSVSVRNFRDIVRLFTGRPVTNVELTTSAVSVAGICVFLEMLRDDSMSAEELERYVVVPGHIEMDERSYQQVVDMSDFDLSGDDFRRRKAGLAAHVVNDVNQLTDDYEEFLMIAQRSSNVLQAGLLLKDDRDIKTLLVGPAGLTNHILATSGLFHCACQPGAITTWPSIANHPVSNHALAHHKPLWIFNGNRLSRIASLACAAKFECCIVWRRNECFECCRKYGQKASTIDPAARAARTSFLGSYITATATAPEDKILGTLILSEQPSNNFEPEYTTSREL
ncbi:MAG: hypothetical protein M1821_000669 [Bathelium mastoideum]|nr:MAG: hypothetical protein M1821_000669 [Bathelium mastoideum]